MSLHLHQYHLSLIHISIADAAKGWIARGVDGLRLDAVKHIYHSETSEENPRFLKMFYEDMNTCYKQQGHTDDFYMAVSYTHLDV